MTGMNFTMLLELLGRRMSINDINDLDITDLMEVGKNGIVNLNYLSGKMNEDDEEL